MASIRKRDGKWQVRWREPDGAGKLTERGDSFTRKKDADALLAKVSRCEELGIRYERPVVEHGDAQLPAIGEGMNAYVAELRTSHLPKTISRYASAFALFARFLDEMHAGEIVAIDELSREMLKAFHAWLGREDTGRHGKARGVYTIKRIVEKVQGAWDWLDEAEWHPAVPRARSIRLMKPRRMPPDAPTWAEMAACVLACATDGGDDQDPSRLHFGARRLATILYYTGLRFEQAFVMTWDLVDVERGTMTVHPHKQSAGRIIPLSQHFVAEIATWGKREGKLCGWDAGETVARRRLNEAWKRAGVREAAWKRAPGKAFRRGVTTGLKLLGIEREDAELYVGREVEGSRGAYLAVGMLPLEHVAAAFPRINATVVSLKREA